MNAPRSSTRIPPQSEKAPPSHPRIRAASIPLVPLIVLLAVVAVSPPGFASDDRTGRQTVDAADTRAGADLVSVDKYGRPMHHAIEADSPVRRQLPPLTPAPPSEARTLGGGLFRPYVIHEIGTGAPVLAIGDVTGDGRADVVVVKPSNDSVYVIPQTPSGTLGPAVGYSVPVCCDFENASVAIAEMNGDGRQDVLVSLRDAVGVMLQTADGRLAEPRVFPTVHHTYTNVFGLTVGDFNHDGLTDVASIDISSPDVDVFLQDPGALLLPSRVETTHLGGIVDLEGGDLDHDGRDDLALMSGAGYYHDNLGVLLQTPAGGFAPPAYYDLGGGETTDGLGVGDVNGDGWDDVVLSYGGNRPQSKIAVLLQQANARLGTPIRLPSYDSPGPVVVADVNLDGRGDVLTLHGGWMALGVYLQDGAGALASEALFLVPYQTFFKLQSMDVGDLNGDSKPDVAIAYLSFGVVVLYNDLDDQIVAAHAGPDTTVECASRDGRGTAVRLDGRESQGEGIAFAWSASGVTFDDGTSSTPTGWFPPGVTAVVLEVSAGGRSARDTVLVTVRDSTPPTLELSVEPSMLWPPNHRLVPVRVTAMATDACDGAPVVRLVSVECSEPGSGSGGPHAGDVFGAAYGESDFDLELRAERGGRGAGRIYTLTYEAADASSLVVRHAVQVVVPHSMAAGVSQEQAAAPEGAPLELAVRPTANPARGRVGLAFDLPGEGRVRLRIFDVGGRALATLADGQFPAGRHQAVFEPASGTPAQVVFYQLEWNGRRVGGRMLVMR